MKTEVPPCQTETSAKYTKRNKDGERERKKNSLYTSECRNQGRDIYEQSEERREKK